MSNEALLEFISKNVTAKGVKNGVRIFITTHLLIVFGIIAILVLLANESSFRTTEAKEHGVFSAKFFQDSIDKKIQEKRIDNIQPVLVDINKSLADKDKRVEKLELNDFGFSKQ